MSKSRSFGIAGRGVSPLAASVTFFLCRRRALDTVARLGRAIRLSSGSSDITAACDDDGDTVKSVNLFFISPTAFRAWAMLTLPVWLWPGSLLLTTLSPDVVSHALHFIVWWYRQRHAIVPHTFSLSLTYSKFRHKTVGFPLLDIPYCKAMLDL